MIEQRFVIIDKYSPSDEEVMVLDSGVDVSQAKSVIQEQWNCLDDRDKTHHYMCLVSIAVMEDECNGDIRPVISDDKTEYAEAQARGWHTINSYNPIAEYGKKAYK